MCLILFAHRLHPDLPLVVAANRDERYARATRPAAFWPEAPGLLAGRDLEAGGTWLGISRNGRFAAVTNVRNGPVSATATRSRGELTRDFLLGDQAPLDYVEELAGRGADYQGFNLLVGDLTQMAYCENLSQRAELLAPGIYGLSNHLLDTPWPKLVSGKNQLTRLLGEWHSAEQADSHHLLGMMTDREVAEDAYLPDTGVGLDLERLLAPIFIEGGHYGTCCSTALIVDHRGRVKFHERSFYREPPEDAVHEFNLER